MRILLAGDGAREHALAEQLARSAELYVVMQRRNPGIEVTAQKYMVCDYSNVEAIGTWAIREKIDVALVTSDFALARGLGDALTEARVAMASPPSPGAVVGENSIYALNLMREKKIPTPAFAICRSEADIVRAAKEFGRTVMKPAVRMEWKGTRFGDLDVKKADIAKEGKVMIKRHGAVVIEEAVDGESFSLQGITDGKMLAIMPPVHVAKRADAGNSGPLTEGMGGFCSGRMLPFMKESDLEAARSALLLLVAGLRAKGVEYRGFIRGEFIAAKKGTLMLSAHATPGDMDSLCCLQLLRSQLSEAIYSASQGQAPQMSFLERAAVAKYLVPEGYPGKPKRKGEIRINDKVVWNNGAKAYCEHVEVRKGRIYAAAGRALALCATGASVDEAGAKAEAATDAVDGPLRHREDIGTMDYVTRCAKHVAFIRST